MGFFKELSIFFFSQVSSHCQIKLVFPTLFVCQSNPSHEIYPPLIIILKGARNWPTNHHESIWKTVFPKEKEEEESRRRKESRAWKLPEPLSVGTEWSSCERPISTLDRVRRVDSHADPDCEFVMNIQTDFFACFFSYHENRTERTKPGGG